MRLRSCFAFLLLAGCITGPSRKGPSDWEIVADDVELVVPDAANDVLYVRAHGRIGRFAPPLAAGESPPPMPSISSLSANAEAFALPTGALRWREGRGRWHGWNPGPGMPPDARPSTLATDLPETTIIEGVLVETPAFGPGWGVPRAVTLLGAPAKHGDSPSDVANPPPEPSAAIPPDAVAAMRGIYALVASSQGVVAIDLANDSTRAFQHGTPVMPAISSDGLLGAASMGVVPLAANVSGQPPIPTETVGVFEGPKPIAAFPIRQHPIRLYFGAGSLFALLPDRTLWKHGLEPVPKARQTLREQAILRHRDGLVVGMREALDAGDVARAGELLDVLYADALMDAPTAEAASLAKELRERARPLFDQAVKQAIDEGNHDLALALDKRVRLIDGQGAGADYLRRPTLQLAIRMPEGAAWTAADVDALFTKRPEFERVERCRPFAERAAASVCLELAAASRPRAPGLLRRVAERGLRGPAYGGPVESCPASEHILLTEDPVRSYRACNSKPLDDDFALAMVLLGGTELDVVTNGGTSGSRPVVAKAGVEGLEQLVDAALDVQIREDSRASDARAATRRLRSAVWSGDPDAVREVVRADATLRPLPNALGPSKPVDGGTPNP